MYPGKQLKIWTGTAGVRECVEGGECGNVSMKKT